MKKKQQRYRIHEARYNTQSIRYYLNRSLRRAQLVGRSGKNALQNRPAATAPRNGAMMFNHCGPLGISYRTRFTYHSAYATEGFRLHHWALWWRNTIGNITADRIFGLSLLTESISGSTRSTTVQRNVAKASTKRPKLIAP